MTFEEKITSAIAEYDMLKKGDAVVAALSGGADSVSLVYALKRLSGELGITVSACHVNHHLRGADSDSDMEFCVSFCRSLDVPLSVLEADVGSMRQKHESLEECARRVRYDFFAEVSRGKKLATAHNLNDSTETVLLNLVRGTGLKGLCGIPPIRGNIIRPLIMCERGEVEAYCAENRLSFVTDKTNLSTDYTRNKIRHIILPELLKINGSFLSCAARMQNAVREDSDYLELIADAALEAAVTEGGYRASALKELSPPIKSRAVRRILIEGGVEPSALRINTAIEIIDSGAGKFNPCLDKFFTVKKGVAFVETSEQRYRRRGRKTSPEAVSGADDEDST